MSECRELLIRDFAVVGGVTRRPHPVRAARPPDRTPGRCGGPDGGRHQPRTAHLHLRRTAGAVQVGAGDGPRPLRVHPGAPLAPDAHLPCRLAPACRRASRHERWRAVPGSAGERRDPRHLLEFAANEDLPGERRLPKDTSLDLRPPLSAFARWARESCHAERGVRWNGSKREEKCSLAVPLGDRPTAWKARALAAARGPAGAHSGRRRDG